MATHEQDQVLVFSRHPDAITGVHCKCINCVSRMGLDTCQVKVWCTVLRRTKGSGLRFFNRPPASLEPRLRQIANLSACPAQAANPQTPLGRSRSVSLGSLTINHLNEQNVCYIDSLLHGNPNLTLFPPCHLNRTEHVSANSLSTGSSIR